MNSGIRRIYAPIIGTAQVANTIGTLVIYALVLIMNADVISRNVFHAPLRGVVEVVIFSLVLIVFLQLPDVVRTNRLTRSDGFLAFVENRFPSVGNVLARAIDLIACVFMLLVAWTIWPEFTESYESCHFFAAPTAGVPDSGEFWADLASAFGRCEYFGTPGIFTAPWWPAKLAIAFSVSMCALIFLFKAVLGDRNPVMIDEGESPV